MYVIVGSSVCNSRQVVYVIVGSSVCYSRQ